MPTSTSNVFGRVNRRRPCRLCGEPDWRSYVRRDGEGVSICMCVSDGAPKINCRGGAIFIHDDLCEEKGIGVRAVASTETRVVCGNVASRLKFRAYWIAVRPFSGLMTTGH
jgi:hypothetical protein